MGQIVMEVNGEESVSFATRIPRQLRNRLKRAALEADVSIQRWVTEALTEAVERGMRDGRRRASQG